MDAVCLRGQFLQNDSSSVRFCPGQLSREPYYEIPMLISTLVTGTGSVCLPLYQDAEGCMTNCFFGIQTKGCRPLPCGHS